jgi:FtsP/CotA-like multicopper oxidase with cupredoxin domain
MKTIYTKLFSMMFLIMMISNAVALTPVQHRVHRIRSNVPASLHTINEITQVPIDPAVIPQFVDPLPHFSAGLRVKAREGGKLIIKTVPHQQIALSTGTVLSNGTIGPQNPEVGVGNYWTYSISKDNGDTWTPPNWPAPTIETERGKALTVTYRNALFGQKYSDLNLTVDQMVHWAMPVMTDEPYSGPVPVVTHLHGAEVTSQSDGDPYAWFTPGYAIKGPSWGIDGTDSVYHYPNTQQAATLWFHDHTMGATRLNIYAGLEGFYFIKGRDEETDRLPGWSHDDLVQEVAPEGTSGTYNHKPYLPEVDLIIQDRMFNDKGELYWPIDAPTNPMLPYWAPEFFGNVMVVNGKSWPYLSVAPRKYRFRVLNACNARFLNMWLADLANNVNGPGIQVVGTDGGLLDSPVVLDPNVSKPSPLPSGTSPTGLFIAPSERFDIVIDFTGLEGKKFTLLNDAVYPYPSGDLTTPELDGRIMQFVVNGKMVSSRADEHQNQGMDKSFVPQVLRRNTLIKLTDFSGGTNITPDKKRQLTLNEHEGDTGPMEVLINNSHYDNNEMIPTPDAFGDATEHPVEGTTELVQIINTTEDAHPIHIHLIQFQLVSRQAYDPEAYDETYEAAFDGGAFKPASGPPMDYNTTNADGAVGGNPAISPFLMGTARPALPEEKGWKDTFKAFPGEVSTLLVRYAPTDLPVNAPASKLMFAFDPSKGPGYVWHCHILDHEDNEMMRPYWVEPSPLRAQQTCLNSTDNLYTAPAGMSDYRWNIPSGGTVVSGGGTDDNFVTIKWTTTGQKLVTVNYTSGNWMLSIPSVFGVNVNALSDHPTVSKDNKALISNISDGNQWFVSDTESGNGTEIHQAIGQVYQPSRGGWYWTQVSHDGCSSKESNRVHVDAALLSLNENPLSKNVEIYPTVNNGNFTVSISDPDQQPLTIQVYNNLGQKVYEQNAANNNPSQQVHLQPGRSGVYTIKIMNSTRQIVRKIIIK